MWTPVRRALAGTTDAVEGGARFRGEHLQMAPLLRSGEVCDSKDWLGTVRKRVLRVAQQPLNVWPV
ncbi:hypothetical protein GCM10008019_32290 [Deinococcus soli (ex Cha et al. 2016)]|nr:hypothetical protein GCM10008019_32290 [Deinococcus soli (ex Cha et al. 2016)]